MINLGHRLCYTITPSPIKLHSMDLSLNCIYGRQTVIDVNNTWNKQQLQLITIRATTHHALRENRFK